MPVKFLALLLEIGASINIDSKYLNTTLDIVSFVLFSFSILLWIFCFVLHELILNRSFHGIIN